MIARMQRTEGLSAMAAGAGAAVDGGPYIAVERLSALAVRQRLRALSRRGWRQVVQFHWCLQQTLVCVVPASACATTTDLLATPLGLAQYARVAHRLPVSPLGYAVGDTVLAADVQSRTVQWHGLTLHARTVAQPSGVLRQRVACLVRYLPRSCYMPIHFYWFMMHLFALLTVRTTGCWPCTTTHTPPRRRP
jgi:hypothetical protein